MRADIVKVSDSVWDDERNQNFLNSPSMGQETEHFSRLLFAYPNMQREDCRRSTAALAKTGGDVKSKDKGGLTLAPEIKAHLKSAAFNSTLEHRS
jgi:hypothetical protein